MTKLEEEKTKEEIKGLKASRYLDILKGLALLFGSVILFIAIQMPESLLNKKMSQESVSRERAKLVFELIHNNKDFENILLELSVIEKAYPNDDNTWISEIKNIYQTKLDNKSNTSILNSIDTNKDKRTVVLRQKLKELLDRKEKIQIELIAEMTGQGGTGKAGMGPVYMQKKEMIMKIDSLVIRLNDEIEELKK